MADLPEGWEARGTPPNLFRRFEFARYGETRAFLDALAASSQSSWNYGRAANLGARAHFDCGSF